MVVYDFFARECVPYKVLLLRLAKRLDAEEMTIHSDGTITLMGKDGCICRRYKPSSEEINKHKMD